MSRRRFKPLAVALLAAALLAAVSAAAAGDGDTRLDGKGLRPGLVQVHSRARLSIGINLGPGYFYPYQPYYYPYYYPYSLGYYPGYYYGPSWAVMPSAPPQYIGRDDDLPAPAYWWRCANPKGYYPYVTACPGGWQRVPARPPTR